MEALWQRLDLWLRAATPFVSALLMTLLSVVAWPIPYLGAVMPPLAFITLFYWSAHRPDLFTPVMAFAIGLLNDVINNFPLGASALLFTLAHQIILRKRGIFAGHSFYMFWAGFSFAVILVMFVQWLFFGLLTWSVAPFLPVFLQAFLGIVVFPLPCWALIQLQKNTVSPN